jgi:hypothetical protein
VTTLEQLDRWRQAGQIDANQRDALARLVSRERFSLFVELNGLLYLGVLAVAGGLAATGRAYADTWGDTAILLPATALLVACFYYCFSRVPPYATWRVPAPGLLFDYVLYLGCLIFAVELGYVEYRFRVLQDQWDYYLLGSAVLYFFLGYRFDNRFVLSLGIATLGGWFGVRFSRADFFYVDLAIRVSALIYGAVVGGVGSVLYYHGIKRHFLDTYLHVSANVILATLASGAVGSEHELAWLAGLIVAAAASILGGIRARRFAFVVYGVLYGYVGVSRQVLEVLSEPTTGLSYIVFSASTVILGLFLLSRQFGRDE